MLFPTKEDVEFFSQPEVREFFGARWEPKVGDWAYNHRYGTGVMFHPYFGTLVFENVIHDCPQGELILLPRPDQLEEMLEGKGYDWAVERNTIVLEPGYVVMTWYVDDPDQKRGEYEGSTSAIALASALMEIG